RTGAVSRCPSCSRARSRRATTARWRWSRSRTAGRRSRSGCPYGRRVADWYAWHEAYDEPGSVIARRLSAVQAQIVGVLSEFPPGRIAVLSMCAGQGRDLIGALAGHPRRHDVVARLVELDP